MNFYSQYAVTPNSVGDWEGYEELAAEQVNRIFMAIEHVLPKNIDPQMAQNIFDKVFNDWGYDLRLLDITDAEILRYTISLIRAAA